MNYHELEVATWYVWQHLLHLMTDEERRIGNAAVARMKAEFVESEPHRRLLLKRWGGIDDPTVQSALGQGPQKYREAVAIRLLADPVAVVLIRRCPHCNRIVRTPAAEQCFWCGHDWHVATSET